MKSPIKELFCILSAGFLTAGVITFFLGGIPMHLSWRTLGRSTYYLCYLGFSLCAIQLGFMAWGLLFATLSLLVGFNNEAMSRGQSYLTSAFFSIGAVSGLSLLFVWFLNFYSGISILQTIRTHMETSLSQLKLPQESLELLSSEEIFIQFPSAIIVLLGITLIMTLISEKRVFSWIGLEAPKRSPLNEFTVPNFIIWTFIISLLGMFLTEKSSLVKQISMNVFNISIFLYFFQGLAVTSKFFDTFKVALHWRLLIIIAFVIYLPLLLSLIGILDFWISFRERFPKRPTQIKERREL